MTRVLIKKSVFYGLVAAVLMLGVYFLVVGGLNDWVFAKEQFQKFWYYITSLALGFGTQIGLYIYLKNSIQTQTASGKIVAVSGATSTVAMVSCCAHYLVNILPIIGITGFIALVAQYQSQLFWVGIASNLAGIVYISNKIIKFQRL